MLIPHLIAVVALLATAVIFGTDVLTAMVMRPVFADLDDRSMVQVTGRSHHYGDKRLPPFGVTGVVATVLASALFFVFGQPAAGTLGGIAVVALLVWLLLFSRISLPINRALIAAAMADEVPADARALQSRWESIIVLRSLLQCLALALIACSLFVG